MCTDLKKHFKKVIITLEGEILNIKKILYVKSSPN